MKRLIICTICTLLLVSSGSGAWLPNNVDRDLWALNTAYLRYGMMNEAVAQARLMAGGKPALEMEIGHVMGEWSKAEKSRIKKQLTNVFGDYSKSAFIDFVDEFTKAEAMNQEALLERWSRSLALAEPFPNNYASFRERVLNKYLATQLKAASDRLGEIETWVELKQTDPKTPPLQTWLSKVVHVQQAPRTQPPKKVAPRPMTEMERLRAMEEPLGELQVSETPTENPMFRYAAKHQERSDRALEEGKAGMAQVATERAAAEERYATKKLAEAQTDAAATKRMAEQFAAIDREALHQRQNSWGKRLKRIIGSTISAGLGAFTGGIGTHAGLEAANALFN